MTSPAPRALLTTASIAVALAAADTYVVVLALTDMMQGVGLGLDALQKATPIISGFLLGYVAVLPLIGRLADLVSRQRVLLTCLGIFIIGSAVTALAVELPVLVAGRVIQGIGGGGLVPATLAIVASLWPADRRGLPLGVVGAVQELGSVLGPVLGALVLTVADWRMIFWLNAVLGILLAGLVVLTGGKRRTADLDGVSGLAKPMRPASNPPAGGKAAAFTWATGVAALVIGGLALAAPTSLSTSVALGGPFVPFGDHTSRLLTPIGVLALALTAAAVGAIVWRGWSVLRRADLLGALLIGGVLGCIILTFASANPEREVVGPLGVALLPIALLCAVGYAVHHRRSRHPLIPRGVLRGRVVWSLLVSFGVGIALVAVVVDVPLLARLIHSSDETQAALILVRFLIAVPVGALLGGWALRALADGPVASAGCALAGIGLLLMATWTRESLDHWPATAVLVLTGLGIGLALAPVSNAALAASPPGAHGTVSALVVVARMTGMVLGLALLTAVGLRRYYAAVADLPSPPSARALIDAAVLQVHSVFYGAAIAAFVAAGLALLLGVRARAVTPAVTLAATTDATTDAPASGGGQSPR